MAQILDIHAQNYMSFAFLQFNFKDLGLCAIKGINIDANADSNGAGKSHLLGVLYWVLYGKTLREVPSAEVVKRHSTGGTWGKLRFKNNRGQILVVERFLKHPRHKNNLYFYPEDAADPYGHPLRGEDKHETQENIVSEINMSRDLFRQIVTFGPEGMTRFSQLSDAGQKKLLEEVLHVSLYEEAASLARKEVAEQTKTRKELEFQYTQTNLHIDQLEKIWRKIERDEALLEKQKVARIKALEEQKENILKRLGHFRALSPLDESTFAEKAKNTQQEMEFLRNAHEDFLNIFRQHYIDKSILLENTRAEYRRIRGEIQRLQHLLDKKICPECHQKIESQAFSQSLEDLYLQVEENKVKGCATRQSLQDAQEEKDQKTQEFEARMSTLRGNLNTLHESIERAQRYNKELQKKEREKARIEIELEGIDWKIEEAMKQDTSLKHQRDSIQEELEKGKSQRQRILEKVDRCNMAEGQYKVLEQVFGPKGIRSFLFETVLPELNRRLQYYCNIVANGHLNAALSVTSLKQSGGIIEKISLRVQNKDGIISYRSCSSGEKRRLDLPIAFALQDIAATRGSSLGICILDEVFENLDETGKDGIMMLLRDIARRPHTRTVLLISHDKDLEITFNNVISVRKRNGTSQIIKKAENFSNAA